MYCVIVNHKGCTSQSDRNPPEVLSHNCVSVSILAFGIVMNVISLNRMIRDLQEMNPFVFGEITQLH